MEPNDAAQWFAQWTNYRIVESNSCVEMEEKVRALKNKGWVPLGGVATVKTGHHEVNEYSSRAKVLYSQAMVQYQKKKPISNSNAAKRTR
jgi:hypothetical protein